LIPAQWVEPRGFVAFDPGAPRGSERPAGVLRRSCGRTSAGRPGSLREAPWIPSAGGVAARSFAVRQPNTRYHTAPGQAAPAGAEGFPCVGGQMLGTCTSKPPFRSTGCSTSAVQMRNLTNHFSSLIARVGPTTPTHLIAGSGRSRPTTGASSHLVNAPRLRDRNRCRFRPESVSLHDDRGVGPDSLGDPQPRRGRSAAHKNCSHLPIVVGPGGVPDRERRLSASDANLVFSDQRDGCVIREILYLPAAMIRDPVRSSRT
jgi:hypothetical protein